MSEIRLVLRRFIRLLKPRHGPPPPPFRKSYDQKGAIQLARLGVSGSPSQVRALDVDTYSLTYMLQLFSPGRNAEGVGFSQQIIDNHCKDFVAESLGNNSYFRNFFEEYEE